jgi:hypothetical protein
MVSIGESVAEANNKRLFETFRVACLQRKIHQKKPRTLMQRHACFLSPISRGQWLSSPKRGIEMDSCKIADVACGPRELSDAELAMVGGAFNWLSILEKAVVGTAAALGSMIGGPGGAVVGGVIGEASFQGAVSGAKYSGAGTNFYF